MRMRQGMILAAALAAGACGSMAVEAEKSLAPAPKVKTSAVKTSAVKAETPPRIMESAQMKAQLSPPATDHHHDADEPRPYDKMADARADVNAALSAARISGKKTIVAMGANWCHDSRGLAAQFEKPRFEALLSEHYELVYVDMGKRDRNLDIAKDFGIDEVVGTPNVVIVSSEGKVLNLKSAPTWRNAASRTEDEIWDYFESYAYRK